MGIPFFLSPITNLPIVHVYVEKLEVGHYCIFGWHLSCSYVKMVGCQYHKEVLAKKIKKSNITKRAMCVKSEKY